MCLSNKAKQKDNFPNPKLQTMSMADTSRSAEKRAKVSQNDEQDDDLEHHEQPLLPGLPDHIAQLCLSVVHPTVLSSVCRSWRRLIYSSSFPPFLSLYALFSSSSSSSNSIQFHTFDPISSTWHLLPPTPPDPPLRLFLRHPAFISRNLPIQSVSASGKLVLLAATSYNLLPALHLPLIFDPLTRNWAFGPQLSTPRRWCAAGVVGGVVYVASGIGSHFSVDVARSVEKWDLSKKLDTRKRYLKWNWKWEKVKGLKDGRFSRDAIEAVGWRRKLCMVNVKGNAAKEGLVYDVDKDTWEEMPLGMIAGWRGPVAAMDEDVMYVVDEGKGALRRYHPGKDLWEHIFECEQLRGAHQMAAGGGRVCVVSSGGIFAVDVAAAQPRIWAVETPLGVEALAVHILPRMSHAYTY